MTRLRDIGISVGKGTEDDEKDYQITKYKNLKKGYKPAEGTQKFTLSNLKYLVDREKFKTQDEIKAWTGQNPSVLKSIQYYFGTIDKFINLLSM